MAVRPHSLSCHTFADDYAITDSTQVPPMHIGHAFEELYQNQAISKLKGGQGHETDEIDVMVSSFRI